MLSYLLNQTKELWGILTRSFLFHGALVSVHRGNNGFLARGSTTGGVILLAFRQEGRAVCLASDTAARLKTPQAPAGLTGGGWLTPAGTENAASTRLGAVLFVH